MAKRLNEAEAYLQKAKSGEELNTDQRRHTVGYLMATQPGLTNMELATMFNCSERTVRLDKQWVREQAAELVTEEDIALVISDIRLSFERYIQRMEKSLNRATPGTRTYLDHLNSMETMRHKVVEALSNLGWYPKNLGQMTKKEYKFVAHVTKDGTVDTRSVEMLDGLINNPNYLSDGNTAQRKRDALDAEFSEEGDVPALPAAPLEIDGNAGPEGQAADGTLETSS